MITDLISSKEGKIIISCVWGLGLASLFRQVCKGRQCIVIEGPKPEEMNNKRAHSEYLYEPFNNVDKPVRVMLECKKKEIALLDYRKKF